jgi:hypothetical protein
MSFVRAETLDGTIGEAVFDTDTDFLASERRLAAAKGQRFAGS